MSQCIRCGARFEGLFPGGTCPACRRNEELLEKQSELAEREAEEQRRRHEELLEASREQAEQREWAEQERMAEFARLQEERLESQRELQEERLEREREIQTNQWKYEAESRVKDAREAYYAGRYPAALALATEAIKQNPNSMRGYELLGQIHGAMGNYQEHARYLYEQIALLKMSEYAREPTREANRILEEILGMGRRDERLIDIFFSAVQTLDYFPYDLRESLSKHGLLDSSHYQDLVKARIALLETHKYNKASSDEPNRLLQEIGYLANNGELIAAFVDASARWSYFPDRLLDSLLASKRLDIAAAIHEKKSATIADSDIFLWHAVPFSMEIHAEGEQSSAWPKKFDELLSSRSSPQGFPEGLKFVLECKGLSVKTKEVICHKTLQRYQSFVIGLDEFLWDTIPCGLQLSQMTEPRNVEFYLKSFADGLKSEKPKNRGAIFQRFRATKVSGRFSEVTINRLRERIVQRYKQWMPEIKHQFAIDAKKARKEKVISYTNEGLFGFVAGIFTFAGGITLTNRKWYESGLVAFIVGLIGWWKCRLSNSRNTKRSYFAKELQQEIDQLTSNLGLSPNEAGTLIGGPIELSRYKSWLIDGVIVALAGCLGLLYVGQLGERLGQLGERRDYADTVEEWRASIPEVKASLGMVNFFSPELSSFVTRPNTRLGEPPLAVPAKLTMTDSGIASANNDAVMYFVELNGPDPVLLGNTNWPESLAESSGGRKQYQCLRLRLSPLDRDFMPRGEVERHYCFASVEDKAQFWHMFNLGYALWQRRHPHLVKLRQQLPAEIAAKERILSGR